jgi:crotonobetainyl-CoA:carnitine CoA-transferase CaiB-like acyl-CoA transferase
MPQRRVVTEEADGRSRFTSDDAQPAPAPRFSRTTLDGPRTPRQGTDETRAILTDAGCMTEEIESLIESGTAR